MSKFIVMMFYFLFGLLLNDTIQWIDAAEDNKEFMNGKVLRILVFNVLYLPSCFIILQTFTKRKQTFDANNVYQFH